MISRKEQGRGRGRRRSKVHDCESLYENKKESDRYWYIERLPDEVLALLDGPAVTKGRALDIGCGIGNLTTLLTPYFQVVAGIDCAQSGIRRAADAARTRDPAPHFVGGDATCIPFDDDSFDYVFDRGCLQGIPLERWPDYFAGVGRVMNSGGHYQLFFRRGDAPYGLRFALHYYLRDPMKMFAANPGSPARLLAHLPPAFVCEAVENVPFYNRPGYPVAFTHIICRKS